MKRLNGFTGAYIVDRIRRMIDQMPFPNEDVSRDSLVIESLSTNFSDEDLLDRVRSAIVAITGQCKAQHVFNLIGSYEGSPAGVSGLDIARLLESSVEVQDPVDPTVWRKARRRTVASHRRLERTGRNATEQYPVYTYERGELKVYPETASTVRLRYIKHDTSTIQKTDIIDLDRRFEAAIVMYVVASCYQTLMQPDMYDYTMSVFEDEIAPFQTQVRYGLLKDDEVAIE